MAAVIAAVLTLFAVPATEAVALAPADSPSTYVCDTHHHPALVTGVVTERGPPAVHHLLTTHDAVDWSRGASARPNTVTTPVDHPYDHLASRVHVDNARATTSGHSEAIHGGLSPFRRAGVAAKGVDIGGAKFAQKSFSETFSKGGAFSGRTIDDVAGDLRSGALTSKDVPIDVIVRDGNSLILNTRSSQALIRAGVPRSSWNVIDRTGQSAFEARLSGQLGRNGLTSSGIDF